jgi:hypothetical protein
MRNKFRFLPTAMLSAVVTVGFAVAADLPKEGRYDFTACWAGVSNTIDFSKGHTAFSFDMTGSIRSNPPGGIFDKESFRCVGMNYTLAGRAGGTTVCEAIGGDGAKRLTFFSLTDGKVVREHVTGTGKYEGLSTSGTVQPLGPFPVIKPGAFQDCNHQTGTYKIK